MRREAGFSLVELLVSISLLAILFGTTYQVLQSFDRIHRENLIAHEIMEIMQTEIEEWRQLQDKTDRTFILDQVTLIQEIDVYPVTPYIERARFIYTWELGKKRWREVWVVDRFCR